MRIRHTVNPRFTEDKDGTSILLGLSDVLAETILDGFASQGNDTRDITLAAGEFDVPLGGPTTIYGFFLRADNDFDLEINNSGQVIQVRRGQTDVATAPKAPDAKVFMEAIVTSLKVTPLADLRLLWAVWGDPITP
jgi:hypothetical protein